VGHVSPEPSQTRGLHDGAPTLPAFAAPQVPSGDVPSAAVHTSHPKTPHAVLQQTPLARLPLAHAVARVAAWPFFNAHAPEPLHVCVLPLQLVCGSVPLVTGLQVPFVPPGASAVEQASHAGHDELPQQTLSTHVLPPHSLHGGDSQSPPVAMLHTAPFVLWSWQLPTPAVPVLAQ